MNLGKRDVLLILGLSFYWPMFRAPYLWTLFSAAPDFAANQNLQALFYCAILLSGILACFTSGSESEARKLPPCSIMVAGVITAAANAAVLSATQFPGIEFDIASAGIVVSSVGFLAITLAWFSSLSARSGKSILRCVALSFLLSFIFGVFDYLPDPLNVLPLWIMPLGTAVLRFAHSSLSCPNSVDPSIEISGSLHMSIFGVLTSVELLASNAVRGLWAYLPTGYTTGIETLITYALSFAAALVLVVVAVSAKSSRQVLTLQLATLTLLLIAGVMMYPFEGAGSPRTLQASQFIATANTGLQCVLWAAMATCVLSQKRALIQAGGVLAVTYAAISLVSLFIIPKACGLLDGFTGSYSTVFSVACIGFIAMGCLACAVVPSLIDRPEPLAFAFRAEENASEADQKNGNGGQEESGANTNSEKPSSLGNEAPKTESPEPPSLSIVEAADSVSQTLSARYGLTSRESEIAVLIARGYSVRRIAEMLVLSPNTVQGYSKCVYRKLGVHSKQSVIDIANEIMAS